jgi:hypothetical protein
MPLHAVVVATLTHVLCATPVGTHNAAIPSMTINTVAVGAAAPFRARSVCAVIAGLGDRAPES